MPSWFRVRFSVLAHLSALGSVRAKALPQFVEVLRTCDVSPQGFQRGWLDPRVLQELGGLGYLAPL